MREWIDTYDERTWQTTDEESGTVRYALIGLGWWTIDVALPAIESSELGEVTVLVSSSSEKADRLAAENDVERGLSYDEFHDGDAADRYDAVYIGTPNAYHLEYAATAASLDKAVLCEKPMEATVERATELVETCERADVPLMIAYRMHTEPAVQRARELIEDGFIGEPVSVYGHNSQPLLEMIPDPDQWRLDPDLSGYGTSVMDLGIYSINTTRYLLQREPVSVRSNMISAHEAFDAVPDERASSLFVFEDDIQMISTASQHAHEDTELKITGTEGQITLQPAFHGECSMDLSRGDVSISVEHETFDAEAEMREEFDYFADRLLGEREIYPDGHHGLGDMRIIEALHESADRGDVVTLDL
ncbi:D-xylose 1-dehydrogenase Gfo6 [Natrialba asiatica]|uniref:Oxidoreductase domain protein n=1 Tax=Natrialba asiatica (strain ATCC 700177 / DSM 12278 / JCM 9576 / FERM P-10747 / NBRC 102637 / 172P1) TaxID=29540 RepID=M0B584_NATA1|nr:D-xylose 1-dehydrogenase Gfo6 [Natrialba asiatica]ELZ06051.1 oxidoreductase domain protein [Natrialba asiatica DSM 12278]